MGGITGFLDHKQLIVKSDLINASTSLKHGSDGHQGILFEENPHYTLGFSNQGMATIDLNPNASQPFKSTCGNFIITFNGVIFNYLKLREDLIKYGVIFSTLSDTEVILQCYKKWGYKAFEMFDGTFSFAIKDNKLNLLIIVTDSLGTKPLYFFKTANLFAFASEIRALLKFPTVKKEINKCALASYFRYGYFIGEETIYQDIFRFKNGTVTTIDLHSGNSYDTPLQKNNLNLDVNNQDSEDLIIAKIEELLTESILKRNVANVPVGVLLSGGYDSATVAAILQNHQTKKIKTFTVGFAAHKLDEAKNASKIATHLKTNHREFQLTKDKVLALVEKLPSVFDEPLGDSATIPMLFLADELRDSIKVLLGSEGGDELFGGSRTYAKVLHLHGEANNLAPNWFKNSAIEIVKKLNPRAKELHEANTLLDKYLAVNACFTKLELQRLFLQQGELKGNEGKEVKNIKYLLTYDLHNYIPKSILLKNERCFNYFGIESRDALLNTDLVAYLATLSPKLFFKDGVQKYLLKKITHKYIPDQLMTDPKKTFVIPLASWLKSTLKPLVDFYLSDAKLMEHNLLNVKEVRRIRTSFKLNPSRHQAQKIWLLLQFQMWYTKWMIQ